MIQINLHIIRSFKDKKLKRFYDRGDASRLPPDMVPRIEEIISLLDIAHDIQDMNVPYFKLHPLTGNRKGEWAVTVRANWRIVFKFDDEPYDVELIDYH